MAITNDKQALQIIRKELVQRCTLHLSPGKAPRAVKRYCNAQERNSLSVPDGRALLVELLNRAAADLRHDIEIFAEVTDSQYERVYDQEAHQ